METPSFHLHRYKRELVFRPLFVYRHAHEQEQEQNRQRLQKIQEIYLQQQNTDQQHLQDLHPIVQINNEFYHAVPLYQLSENQQYVQQYYQQYYNKYFQQYSKNSYNLL